MRWLRTVSRQAANSVIGVSPMRRHQPRLMSLAAGSLAVEKVRSAAEGRGAGPAGAGGGGGVVVFLRGLGGDVGWHGNGLLGAAGRRVLRRAEDLGPLVAQGH